MDSLGVPGGARMKQFMDLQRVGRGEKETIYGLPRCSKCQDEIVKFLGPSFQYPVPRFQVASFKYRGAKRKRFMDARGVPSFTIQAARSKVQVSSTQFRSPSSKFQVSNSKCPVSRSPCHVRSSKFQVSSFKFQVSSFKLRVSKSGPTKR